MPDRTTITVLYVTGLTPRFKVTCEGVFRVMKVNGIDCPSDVDLSCTIKLDDDMLVSFLVGCGMRSL